MIMKLWEFALCTLPGLALAAVAGALDKKMGIKQTRVESAKESTHIVVVWASREEERRRSGYYERRQLERERKREQKQEQERQRQRERERRRQLKEASRGAPKGPSTSAAGAAAGSKHRINRKQLELLLSAEDLLTLDRRELEQLGIVSCPHCRTGVELETGVDLATAECPACNGPLQVEDEAADAAFRSYRHKKRLQECPRCKATVEKTAGCNHMACRCGAHFCYTCGADTTSESGYQHWNSLGLRECRLFDR